MYELCKVAPRIDTHCHKLYDTLAVDLQSCIIHNCKNQHPLFVWMLEIVNKILGIFL